MAHLMEFKKENVLEIPLLDFTGNVLVSPVTPSEEATLLEEPQAAQVTTACSLRCGEQAPELEGIIELER